MPDGIGDLGFAMRLLRESQIGEEQQVDQGVYKLLCQRFRLLELVGGRLHIFPPFIEKNFVRDGGTPCSLSPRAPEEFILPAMQMVHFVQIGQDTS